MHDKGERAVNIGLDGGGRRAHSRAAILLEMMTPAAGRLSSNTRSSGEPVRMPRRRQCHWFELALLAAIELNDRRKRRVGRARVERRGKEDLAAHPSNEINPDDISSRRYLREFEAPARAA